ncbi:hypothetical protein MSPP1_002822 [Malassezia sp. CBS 17886]|nr:hypothetical protein MSPP1_002822 [Malassezia sp. CBS 17886]
MTPSPHCSARVQSGRNRFADIEDLTLDAFASTGGATGERERDGVSAPRIRGRDTTPTAEGPDVDSSPPLSPVGSQSSVPGVSSDDLGSPAHEWIRAMGSSPSRWYEGDA